MKEQLLAAWSTHQRMNALVLNNLDEKMLDKTLSTKGGRTIRLQFIHMHQTRLQWLEGCAKDIFKTQTALNKTANPTKAELNQALEASAIALSELFSKGWDNHGIIRGFKGGLFSMFGYFISHESHHRGNILLTLRQTGEKIPDNVKWELWNWGN